MTTPNVYGRTEPMTAKEREAFEASVKALESRSPRAAQDARALWQKIVEVIGEESSD